MIKQLNKWYLWQGAVIFFLCVFSYGNSLMNGFMMDDYVLLFTGMRSLKWSFAMFADTLNGFYRPLGACFLKLVYSLFGSNPLGYHLVNLFLFFIICMFFLFIVRWLFLNSTSNLSEKDRLARANGVSFIAAALYSVHPINNMIVNYKTACMLAIFIICMQASFISFLAFLNNQKKSCYWLSVFFYCCALFSHEMSSILPLYLLMAACYLKNWRFKTALFSLWPYLLCFIFYISVWSQISTRQQYLEGVFSIPFGIYLATLSKLLQWYLSKLFFPHHFLFIWDIPVTGKNALVKCVEFIGGMGLLAGLYFILVHLKKRFEIFCLTLFLAGFLPFCLAAISYNILDKTAEIEPHWFYFSSIGIFVLIASLLVSLGWHWHQWFKIPALCALILLLALMTRQSNLAWRDNETYCKYWIKLNPLNGSPYAYLKIESPETPMGL